MIDDKKVNAEKRRLIKQFSHVPKNKLETFQGLIERAAFYRVAISDLEETIIADGYDEPYQNGANQKGRKRTAAADLHIAFTRNYTTVMKQLHSFFGGCGDAEGVDTFDRF